MGGAITRHPPSIPNYYPKEDKNMYFVIKKSKPGAYWWLIKSDGNHETLASSEILNTKTDCLNAINIVHSQAKDAKYRDETGE